MSVNHLPYSETGYFSKTICDYLAQNDAISPFYNRFPSLENLQRQTNEKQNFDAAWRQRLSERLMASYEGFPISEVTQQNIELLRQENTFTITTGHQLNLFTGPLYFLYKIVSVINFCKQAKAAYPQYEFVPVYWMATEDHDFDEINYFNFKGSKISWNREDGGAVGELTTDGLSDVFKVFKTVTGNNNNAKELQSLFEEAYLEHDDLAGATRFLANAIFAAEGLVIVDGNDPGLKEAFVPYAKKELLEQTAHNAITDTTERLIQAGYKEQVHPREINLFFLDKGLRERIVADGQNYHINNTDLFFGREEILAELQTNPERFSPNALLRPLYQEVILPNLCYIGGGGELAYWLQLKDYFAAVEVPMPMLMLRNSALIISEKQKQKVEKLGLSIQDLFLKPLALSDKLVKKYTELPVDFSQQKEHLVKQFEYLHQLAAQTDPSFKGAVAAQQKKQLNGLDRLEKRLKRAEKRNHKERIERVLAIQAALFPGGSLQERNTNFSEFYLEYGPSLLTTLLSELDPFTPEFSLVCL